MTAIMTINDAWQFIEPQGARDRDVLKTFGRKGVGVWAASGDRQLEYGGAQSTRAQAAKVGSYAKTGPKACPQRASDALQAARLPN
jgi:hypothetical protein